MNIHSYCLSVINHKMKHTVLLYRSSDGISGLGPKTRASMFLFRDANYTQPYPGGVVTLPVGSPLYVGVFVPWSDPRFVVVLENCYTTYTPDGHGPVHNSLIQNKWVFSSLSTMFESYSENMNNSTYTSVLLTWSNATFSLQVSHRQPTRVHNRERLVAAWPFLCCAFPARKWIQRYFPSLQP